LIANCSYLSSRQTLSREDDLNHLLSSLAVILLIVEEGVVIFALRYIFRSIALFCELIVDKTKLASLLSWGDSVQTNEELGAVVGIGVLGVRIELSKLISGSVRGTLEPVSGLQSIGLSLALLPVGDLWPVTDAAVLIKPQAGGAGVLLCLTINTGVEDVADSGVGVGVETIEAGTQVTRALGLLELQSVATVNIEVMITGLSLPGERVED